MYAGTKGYLDKLPVDSLGEFERDVYRHMDEKHPDLWKKMREKKAITDDIKGELDSVLKAFSESFVASKG